jgi:hypothetical protein
MPPRIDSPDLERTAVGFAQTDKAFNRGRLARAIRPQQAKDFPARHLKADAAHSADPGVTLLEVADNDVSGHRATRKIAGLRRGETEHR